MNELVPALAPAVFPVPFFAPRPRSACATSSPLSSITTTRKAYMNATRRFAARCKVRGIPELSAVEPFHVAAFLKDLQHKDHQPKPFTPPTVKQHLAALRMLFDWLVIGQVIRVTPAHAVRGPKHVMKKGKTPVLTADEARELLDSITIAKNTARKGQPECFEPLLVGLRDRALIALMVYSFARVNATLKMKVRDYFVQGRRGCRRKAARSTRCPAITISKSTSMSTSPPPASWPTRRDPYSAPRPVSVRRPF
jgi:site-specific recombinase XerD